MTPEETTRILSSLGYSDELRGSVHADLDAPTTRVASLPMFSGVRIHLYRSVAEVSIENIPSLLAIVGPNNAGKTNVLKAIELFLSAHNDQQDYVRGRDLTFGSTERQRTFVNGDFLVDQGSELAAKFQTFAVKTGFAPRTVADALVVALRVEFQARGPSVRIMGPKVSTGMDEELTEIESSLISDLLSSFAVHYIPSVKNVRELYRDLIAPAFVRTAARALEPHIDLLNAELSSISEVLNVSLAEIGLGSVTTALGIPDHSLERLMQTGFDLRVNDPHPTSIFEKGHGIQTTVLLASLLWMTEDDIRRGKTSVWLLEEPESYLHPELSHACRRLLDQLATRSNVILTTHSLSFVPAEVDRVRGIEMVDTHTTIKRYNSYRGATEHIRSSLGVRFADFLQLGDVNIIVEGESDVRWLRWYLSHADEAWPLLSRAQILAMGGAQQIRSFLEWSLERLRQECRLVALLDGDGEGLAVHGSLLASKLAKKLPLIDYLQITRAGFAVEALVPDKWIEDLANSEPDIFEPGGYDADPEGSLLVLTVKDKFRYLELMKERAALSPLGWDTRLAKLCNELERRLARQQPSTG